MLVRGTATLVEHAGRMIANAAMARAGLGTNWARDHTGSTALPEIVMKAARFALALSVTAVIALLIAGPGSRLGWWEFRTGFQVLRWAAILGLAAGGLALATLLFPRPRRNRVATLMTAVVLGFGTAAVPLYFMRKARTVPPIHDITTDTAQPPEFVAIRPLRAGAPNAIEYGGAEVARAQRAAYPDVQPVRLAVPPAVAFERALHAVQALGWDLVSADAASGRIEATDTTLWFGFKDDVVVRIRPDGTGTRIDVRSLSRVGGSDVGANAQRIRAFIRALRG